MLEFIRIRLVGCPRFGYSCGLYETAVCCPSVCIFSAIGVGPNFVLLAFYWSVALLPVLAHVSSRLCAAGLQSSYRVGVPTGVACLQRRDFTRVGIFSDGCGGGPIVR